MDVQTVPIDSLSLDPANVRRHPTRNLEAIAASLRRFGQQRPLVVDAKGIVRAGNGTLEAARQLGWTEIRVTRTELKGSEATAFAIADNRSAELAEWGFEDLATTLKSLQLEGSPIDDLGWDPHELEPLLAADWNPPEVDALPTRDGDESDGDDSAGPHTIELTPLEHAAVLDAAEACREVHEDDRMTLGRCLQLICEGYVDSASKAGR